MAFITLVLTACVMAIALVRVTHVTFKHVTNGGATCYTAGEEACAAGMEI